MRQARVFSAFIKQIIRTNQKQKLYYPSKTINQSSVGLVFKCDTPSQFQNISSLIENWKSIKNVELLMVQRAGYQKDVNAYNIVFPGGQTDANQSDLQACKRQIKQQVNLEVDNDCIYVGKMPKNFYYAKKRQRFVYISCHIWVLKYNCSFMPKLNPQELIDYRWVPFMQIADPSNLTVYNATNFGFFNRLAWKFLRNSVAQNLEIVNLPGMNVKMKRDLWGLTLWLVNYILQMSQENMKRHMESQEDQTLIESIEVITQKLKQIEVRFKRKYVIGIPMIWMVKIWHYNNRVRQFTYSVKSQRQRYLSGLIILIVSLCLIAFILQHLQ